MSSEPAEPLHVAAFPRGRFPASERLVSLFVLVFSLYTVCSQITVALGGTFYQLLTVYPVVLAAAALVWRRFAVAGRRSPPELSPAADCRVPSDDYAVEKNDPLSPGAGGRRDRRDLLLRLLLVAALAVAMPWLRFRPFGLWWTITGFLVVGAFVSWRRRGSLPSPAESSGGERTVWILSGLTALYALVIHRPDADDAFYVNMAAAALDRPELALLAADTLHGTGASGAQLPVYVVHSWEFWNAALAFFAGVSALGAFHYLSTFLVAFLTPMAWGMLCRRLFPRHWLPLLGTFLFVLILPGEVHRWYGNFGPVRAWQGKALFLSVLVPFLWTHALRFGRRPTLRRGAWLVAGQIAAVGATSSAIWAGLVVVFVGTLTGVRKESILRLALAGAVLGAYPIAIGLKLKGDMSRFTDRVLDQVGEPGTEWLEGLATVLGTGPLSMLCLVAVATAWIVVPNEAARRFCSVGILLLWAGLLNPFVAHLVSAHVTGPSYWRSLWALPVPFLAAILLCAPWWLLSSRAQATTAWVLVLGAFAFLPQSTGWSAANGVQRIGLPGYKVDRPSFVQASILTDHVPDESLVVAPYPAAVWIPTLQDYAQAVAVRGYLNATSPRHVDRLMMRDLASGPKRTPHMLRDFRAALWRHRVEAVLFATHPNGEALRETLRAARFEPAVTRPDWELWVRRGLDPQADPRSDQPLRWQLR